MPRPHMLLPFLALTVGLVTASVADAQVERRLEQTYRVTAGSTVVVKITGGPIAVTTGPSGTVQLTLDQVVDVSSSAQADEILAEHEISAIQQGAVVTLTARRRMEDDRSYRRRNRNVRFSARLTVPADVDLDLDTSGGPIDVRGERTAPLKADTSGGPITVDGGQGEMDLDTSGGPIRVGRALSVLRADTSGGGITVDYVGPAATSVSLDTSGGTIRVGVDRAAKLTISAETSGGSVSLDGLPFESQTIRRSRASGTINGGGGRLTADTSGGSIEIRAATR